MPTSTVFTPTVSATLNGTAIAGVRKARVISSFNDPVTKLYLSVYPAISYTAGDTLAITMGSGTNNVLSGTGQIYEGDYLNSGPTFELVARGPLFKAQQYNNNVANGLTLTALTGGPATDEVIARAVLTVAGVSFTPSDIGGTGLQRGTLAPSAYTWRQNETALDYLNRLSKASLGYRMVETIGGTVKRVQVFGRPSSTSTYSLSQGVDIFAGGHTQLDAFGQYTAVTVTGYDYGTGRGPVSFSYPNPVPAGIAPYTFSSEMIERGQENDTGGGISAANIAMSFVLPEVNRVTTRVSSIKTPRDDVFQPGQTHLIDSSYLGLSNTLLACMSVTRECDDKWFAQTMEYLGGGAAIDGYVIPPGLSTFIMDLPPRARPRMRDYTFVDNAQIPQLLGLDFMVPGKQYSTDYIRRRVFPQQPWNERSHGGQLGVNSPI
jgi:hypothetical protein